MTAPLPTLRQSRRPQIVRWLFAAIVGVATFGLGAQTAAAADNTVVSSTPAEGAQVASSPAQITITFAAPLGGKNIVTIECNTQPILVGDPSVGPDQVTLTVALPNPLPKGDCTVRWSVSAPEGGNAGTDTITFAILADDATAPTTTSVTGDQSTTVSTTATSTDTATSGGDSASTESGSSSSGPEGLMRLIATIGLAVLFGSLVLIALAWPEGVEYILTVRFLRIVCGVAIAGSFFHLVTMTALITNRSIAASINPLAWTDLTSSGPGLAALFRFLFAVGCVWVVARPERVIDQMTQMAALAIPGLAVATFGFSRSGGDLALIGHLAGVVHALAMSVWVGGLVLLTRVVLSGPGDEDLVHAVRGFSRMSTAAIVATVVSGGVQLYRLDRGSALLTSGHGRVVLLKALLVVGVVFIGTMSRQLIQQKLSRAEVLGPKMAARLKKALGVEAVAGIVILALSSILLTMTPANVAVAQTPDVGAAQLFKNDSLEVSVAFSQVVGPNAVRIEVAKPVTGISDLTVEFLPPDGSGANGVTFFVPAMTAPGAVYLPKSEGMPLEAPGRWTVTVKVGGNELASKSVNVEGAGGAVVATTSTVAP